MEFFKRIIQVPDLPDVSDTFPYICPHLLSFNNKNDDDHSQTLGMFPITNTSFYPSVSSKLPPRGCPGRV